MGRVQCFPGTKTAFGDKYFTQIIASYICERLQTRKPVFWDLEQSLVSGSNMRGERIALCILVSVSFTSVQFFKLKGSEEEDQVKRDGFHRLLHIVLHAEHCIELILVLLRSEFIRISHITQEFVGGGRYA